MSGKNSDGNDDTFRVSAKADMSGILFKKPFGAQHSNKWSKKFFVLKDGYLLYYNEHEKKAFEKRGYLNIHPKGALPLGGCSIDSSSDGSNQHVIYIRSNDFTTGFVCLGAESEFEREKWISALQEASRITLTNARLGEDLIRELENRGLKLSKERQDCFHKLQEETMALRDEIDKNEELERIKLELDKEKRKLEVLVEEMKSSHTKAKLEYESTIEAMKTIDDEKTELKQTTELLQETLSQLAEERENTVKALSKTEEENQSLSMVANDLQQSLFTIEEETKLILIEKREVEKRFVENAAMFHMLAEEKEIFSAQANQLLSSLNDLMCQKEMTEAELKDEIVARIQTEKRLFDAESSLMNLEDAIRKQGSKKIKVNELCDQVLPHVQNLKKFFECAAMEAKVDANMPMIMKNAVLARKTFIQRHRVAKHQQERIDKAKSLGVVIKNSDEPFIATLCRTYSTIGKSKSRPKNIAQLRRSLSTRLPRYSNDYDSNSKN